MLSRESLLLVDTIARTGNFTAAAKALHRVPSAVSYAIKQLEEELGVVLFVRQHRSVALTDAGRHFVAKARELLSDMQELKRESQRIANGWQPALSIVVDNIVCADRISQLMSDFYRQFDDVELIVRIEVFNGVWEVLATGRSDIAIGATTAVPVGGEFRFRDMGAIDWAFLVSPGHPLAGIDRALQHDDLQPFPSICLEDSAVTIPRRTTWLLPRQRRLVVPDWTRAIHCFTEGLGIGYLPAHLARPLIQAGALVEKRIAEPKAASPCCVAWHGDRSSPALAWVIDYLGDSDTLHREWLS